jgi:pimeloyl-ACP methyl ester carboxylesterase
MKRRTKIILALTGFVVGGFVIALGVLQAFTYPAFNEGRAILLLEHTEDIGSAMIVHPSGDPKATIIFYPGGLVEPESYLFLANGLSMKEYRVIIPRMPLNLAILGQTRANDYLDYVEGPLLLAGHSLGGASAAFYADRFPDQLQGLIFIAAYPPSSLDFSERTLPVLSLTATLDLVLDETAFNETQALLPPTTVYASIEGGNHAGFGSYGPQRGDGVALITRFDQHQRTIEAIEAWFSDAFEEEAS